MRFKEPEGERRSALLKLLRQTTSPDVMHELQVAYSGVYLPEREGT